MAAILGVLLIVFSLPLTAYVAACWAIDASHAPWEPPRFSHAAWLFPLAVAAAGIVLILHS